MYYLNTTCAINLHHNVFIATGTLDHTHVYMQLELKNTGSVQATFTSGRTKNMEEEHGLKKHRVCKNCNKSAYTKQICIT